MKSGFPVYRQIDEMDCGPTCLQMIAAHYGRHLSLQEVRDLTNVDREGVSLLGLTTAAEAIGMNTLSIRISLDDLIRQAKFPCIVHFNDHFVVVYKAEKNKLHVADPGPGALVYTREQFLKRWRAPEHGIEVGVALLLEPGTSFRKNTDRNSRSASTHGIHELIGYLKNYKVQLFKIAACLLVASSIQLLFPFVTQSVVDKGIANKDLSFLYLVLAGQLVLTFSRTTMEFVRRWIVLKLSNLINLSILSEFLGKLMRLPVGFFEQKKVGDILRRIDDHARIERFITSSSLSFSFSQITFVVYSGVLCYYNVSIFLVFLAASVIYITFILTFMKKKRELDYRTFDDTALMDSSVIEIAEGIQEVKLNNFEEQSLSNWKRTQQKIFDIRMITTRISQYQEGGGTLINETRNVLITFMAASQVIEGSMTVGAMLAIQFMIGQLQAPIADLLNFSKEYQEAKISLERIGEVKHIASEDEGLVPKEIDTATHNDVVFDNISFSYPGRHSSVILESVNVLFPQGKVTALVGKSGSGKSSMLKLLMKFYKPDSGTIHIGDTDLASVRASSWRAQCGVVMQDGFIFSETLARNIALANEIDTKKLNQVIEITNLKEFIDELPAGLNTKIGPSGTGISAGQRQRILIARAIYKDPACLLLDEATSALDAVNERAIINNISKFGQGRTTIIIAHRLSTIRNADQIIALEHGSVAETGTHDELIARKGVYYDLVTNQMHIQDVSTSYHEPSEIPRTR